MDGHFMAAPNAEELGREIADAVAALRSARERGDQEGERAASALCRSLALRVSTEARPADGAIAEEEERDPEERDDDFGLPDPVNEACELASFLTVALVDLWRAREADDQELAAQATGGCVDVVNMVLDQLDEPLPNGRWVSVDAALAKFHQQVRKRNALGVLWASNELLSLVKMIFDETRKGRELVFSNEETAAFDAAAALGTADLERLH